MKGTILLLLVFSFTVRSQEIQQIPLHFDERSAGLTQTVKKEVDHYYDLLKRGRELEFTFLSKKEKKLKQDYVANLTKKRADAVSEYLLRKQVSSEDIYVSLESFNKKQSSVPMSNKNYRAFTCRSGINTVRVRKTFDYLPPYTRSEVLNNKNCGAYEIDPTEKNTIVGSYGTQITFQANALVYQDGSLPACDKVNICLKEYYDKSDFVMNDLTTSSDRKMLESGGMIYIDATCNGQQLRLKTNRPVEIRLPRAYDQEFNSKMNRFIGSEKRGIIDWKESRSDDVEEAELLGEEIYYEGEGYLEAPVMDAYLMKSTKLGWINCDYFYDVEQPVDLFVETPQEFKPAVRLVFTDINSVLPGYYYNPEKLVKLESIPKDKEATLIAYSKQNGKIYAAIRPITTGEKEVEKLELKEMTLNQFQSHLQALNY